MATHTSYVYLEPRPDKQTQELGESFYALERDAAPGSDGITWHAYKANLEENLRALHDRLHQGRYRTQPLRPDSKRPDLCGGCWETGIPTAIH